MIGNNVLILAPHTDDGEFGCGGTISKLVEEGKNVSYAAFSVAEKSVPEEFPSNILETEVRKAITVLGIPERNLHIFPYEVRMFSLHRQEILEDIIGLQRTLDPDTIFLPAMHDIHQDHQVVAMEGLRAFKRRTILSYEMPWNNLTYQTQGFVFLDERHVERKIEALKCYESQKNKPYASADFIRSLAVTRGTQIGVKYAECFEIVRMVVK